MKMRIMGVVLLATLCLVGCRIGKDVYNPSNTFATAGNTSIDIQDVRKAIMTACADLHWSAFERDPGVIMAKLVVRGKHTAQVRITYSDTNYAITYESSDNLEYEEKSSGRKIIHPNYNKWVGNLQARINTNIQHLQK